MIFQNMIIVLTYNGEDDFWITRLSKFKVHSTPVDTFVGVSYMIDSQLSGIFVRNKERPGAKYTIVRPPFGIFEISFTSIDAAQNK